MKITNYFIVVLTFTISSSIFAKVNEYSEKKNSRLF